MLCSKCGSPGTGRFCVQCGGALVEPPPPAPVAPPRPSPPPSPPPMSAAAMTAGINAATMTAASIAEANARAAEVPPEITRDGNARQAASAYLKLQPSEQAVLAAASRVFAALITTNQVTEANEPEMVNRAVRAAVRLAMITERVVQSDDEDW